MDSGGEVLLSVETAVESYGRTGSDVMDNFGHGAAFVSPHAVQFVLQHLHISREVAGGDRRGYAAADLVDGGGNHADFDARSVHVVGGAEGVGMDDRVGVRRVAANIRDGLVDRRNVGKFRYGGKIQNLVNGQPTCHHILRRVNARRFESQIRLQLVLQGADILGQAAVDVDQDAALRVELQKGIIFGQGRRAIPPPFSPLPPPIGVFVP